MLLTVCLEELRRGSIQTIIYAYVYYMPGLWENILGKYNHNEMEEISDRIFVKLNDVTYIKFRRYKEKNILVKYSAIRASIHDKNNQGH